MTTQRQCVDYRVFASEIAALVGFDKFHVPEAITAAIHARADETVSHSLSSITFGASLQSSVAAPLHNQSKTLSKSIGSSVTVSGRIKDFTLSNGEVVPKITKKRKNRLPTKLYENDHVLCLAYAFLSDSKTAILCNIVQGTNEQQSIIVKFCDKRWAEVCRLIKCALDVPATSKDRSGPTTGPTIGPSDEGC
jgi:hypothetical protein